MAHFEVLTSLRQNVSRAELAGVGDPLSKAARIALPADAAVPMIEPGDVRSALADISAT